MKLLKPLTILVGAATLVGIAIGSQRPSLTWLGGLVFLGIIYLCTVLLPMLLTKLILEVIINRKSLGVVNVQAAWYPLVLAVPLYAYYGWNIGHAMHLTDIGNGEGGWNVIGVVLISVGLIWVAPLLSVICTAIYITTRRKRR